jgi:geranylgeranyl diphosphate synthase, type II
MLELEKARCIFQEQLDSLNFNSEPFQLYDPIKYILSLGGKKIRPALAIMSGSIFNDNYEAIIPAAIALEIFHNFTLLHDDIMDNSILRRSKPTVHVKWNINTAILSGDAMLILAFQTIQKSDQKNLPIVMDVFTQTALRVCEGQQFDMEFENRMDVSEEEYFKMIELKTAVLIAACMKIGAIIAGASQKDADLLYEAGKNLGMAFQLKDDLLDTFGSTSKFGKRIGGDIIENKKTYLFICARDNAGPAERDELYKLYGSSNENEDEKIKAVCRIFTRTEVQKLTETKIQQNIQKAFTCCEMLSSSPEIKKELISLFDYLISREN